MDPYVCVVPVSLIPFYLGLLIFHLSLPKLPYFNTPHQLESSRVCSGVGQLVEATDMGFSWAPPVGFFEGYWRLCFGFRLATVFLTFHTAEVNQVCTSVEGHGWFWITVGFCLLGCRPPFTLGLFCGVHLFTFPWVMEKSLFYGPAGWWGYLYIYSIFLSKEHCASHVFCNALPTKLCHRFSQQICKQKDQWMTC